MADKNSQDRWQVTLVANRFLWMKETLRPGDMSDKLRDVMLARENLIEDADFQKVVPNRFIVELNPEVYASQYRPIEPRILAQWRERLLEDLELANRRQGRLEYRFGGRVEIQVRAGDGLPSSAARIYSQVRFATAELRLSACLELVPGGQRWHLRRGTLLLGRDASCDILLDGPAVKEFRLISAQHAYIECTESRCVLFDGAPSGRPSTNGTFVNGRPVPPGGHPLADGDLILLAALARTDPRPDTPGVAVLRFRLECSA
jgi:hypothetical protein